MDCNLEFALHQFCQEQGFDRTYWIAYSGGLDSHVLLFLFANLRQHYPVKFKAVHINHSLSPNAALWSAHCEKNCEALQIDFIQKIIQAKAEVGESPEEKAREKRYAVLSQLLAPNDFLVTAHHQDDQAETLFLQLLRGAGPKGLAAMPSIKKLGAGFQARPLLSFTRAELFSYAQENNLHWIEDESNTNINFSRNFIRQHIFPVLKNRWPSVTETLARVAAHCGEAQELLDEIATADLSQARGSQPKTLSVSYLLTLSAARQRQVIRLWLTEQHYLVPDTVKLQQVQREILHARQDKNPHVAWKNAELRRYRDDIYVMDRLPQLDQSQIFSWDLQTPLSIDALGILRADLKQGEGLRAELKDITVRFRQGGEVCQLPKRDYTHSLKKLFWEWKVPPWERERIPLIFVANELAAAPGYFVSEKFSAREGEEGYAVFFEKS